MKKGKIIVVSAPSGTGKSTIIKEILQKKEIDMRFSVSATNRAPRPGEIDGVSYNFLSTEQFRSLIDNDGFVEWEEVYPGGYYGTLKSEISKTLQDGHNVILDIDVKGAVNVKKMYGHDAITIFIEPPSVEVLGQRLLSRGTETPESLAQRLQKAEFELGYADKFDVVVVNDDLSKAISDTETYIKSFLNQTHN